MAAKPMLGEVELQLVQKIDSEGDQVLAEHGVPALEGDFLQGLGRRAERLTLNGVLTGPEAGEGLKTLREKFRAAEPVSFVADISSATKVDKVLIEEMGVRDLAGKPERFEYAFALREFLPPPPAQTEEPPPPPPEPDPPPLPTPDVGTLVVEVIVEGAPDFDLDLSTVRVTAEGTTESGRSLARTLQNRSANIWEEQIAPGQYTVRAISNPQGMAPAQVRGGQTTPVTITLRTGAVVARQFLVHFRFDKAFVEPCMREVLRRAAARAASSSAEKLLIVGHTDKVDDPSYNQSLSERRARAVHAFLTFGRARQAAIDEWEALRKPRTTRRGQPTLEDRWDTREYQHILQDLRFYPGNIDGRHGDLTDEAVRAYRCHKGLPPGTQVDDEVWRALIEDYLAQDNLAVPADRFFPNCDSEIVKWLGAGEEDPVDNTAAPHRPSRRIELLFVRADRLPCQVPQPDTFALPQAGAVNNGWCIGPPQPGGNHVCFVTKHLGANGRPQPCSATPGGPFCREPADPATLTLRGSIRDENGAPLPSQPFVIITPKGEFLRRENATGDGDPAMTDNSGEFSFPDKPAGFYSLEVRPFRGRNFLVRLDGEGDATIKGNTVCKELRRDQDHLDVVVVNAPIVREIRLPVVVHLMTALHPATREIRTCPAAAGGREPQATALTKDQVRAAFDEANTIWRQARIRFTLDDADIVREFYSFRTECEVDHTEFLIVAERCGVPDAVNVLFFGDLAGQGEAGFGLSPETAAAGGVNASGCAVGDRAQANFGGLLIDITLNDQQRAQVLAHELGHHLNLDHAGDTPADAARLMRPNTSDGSNRTLTPDEVTRARASRAASDDCVPLTLSVSGATRIGSSRSHHFILVQDPAATVTVDAQIPARLIDPALGTLTMTGGNPGANPLQRTISGTAIGETEVVATYTPANGNPPITARALIRVVTFPELRVEGVAAISSGVGAGVVEVVLSPEAEVTVFAQIDPAPFCVPDNLVNWTGGLPAADPLRRIVRGTAAGETTVQATLGATTRQVVIRFLDATRQGTFRVGRHEYTEAEEGTFDLPLPGGPPGSTFAVRSRAIVRYPADADGVNVPVSPRQATYPMVVILHGNHRRFRPNGAFVESYRGFDYLASHLASYGYIALSIDADDINARPRAILERGEAILHHIQIMFNRHASGPLFTGRVDVSRIGLIGHSRGGEGVLAGQQLNVSRGIGRQIRAIVSIAPTNAEDFVHNTTPYLVIYGSSDGDVSGASDSGNPFLIFDRAAPPKAMLFAYGAIHNRFSTNSDWLDPTQIDNDDARTLSETDHQNIAKGYTLSFFERHLRGQLAFDVQFKRYGRPPGVAQVELHHQFSDPTRRMVDDFEQLPHNAAVNTLTRGVTQTGLATPTGQAAALVEVSLRQSDTASFVQASFGAMIAWDSTAGVYTTSLGGLNAFAFQVLSFRVTQRFGSARNPVNAVQDFFVRLTDVAGEQAAIQVSTVTSIPFPFVRHDHAALHPPPPGSTRFVDESPDRASLTKSALKTIRLPLAAFRANNPQLNLLALQAVAFEFRQTASGEVAVDDLEFSN